MADAVLAGHEHHCRRHDGVEIAGVVTGAGCDAAMRMAEHFRCVLDVGGFGSKCVGGCAGQVDLGLDLRRAASRRRRARSLSSASMTAASALRKSAVKAISPGMTLRDGFAMTASPMVPTAFGPLTVSDALHRQYDFRQGASASRRSGIGVEPAWLSKP
jgi:hypothetical protein